MNPIEPQLPFTGQKWVENKLDRYLQIDPVFYPEKIHATAISLILNQPCGKLFIAQFPGCNLYSTTTESEILTSEWGSFR